MKRVGPVFEALVAALGITAILGMGGSWILIGALVVAAISIALLRNRRTTPHEPSTFESHLSANAGDRHRSDS